MHMSLDRPDYYALLGLKIPINPDVKRWAISRPVEFRILIGDAHLYDWRRSFESANQRVSYSQSLSNIQGGLGLFTSYDDKSLWWQALMPNWYDKLGQREETKELNFQNHPWQ